MPKAWQVGVLELSMVDSTLCGVCERTMCGTLVHDRPLHVRALRLSIVSARLRCIWSLGAMLGYELDCLIDMDPDM